jgi:hypothetical protein
MLNGADGISYLKDAAAIRLEGDSSTSMFSIDRRKSRFQFNQSLSPLFQSRIVQKSSH